MSMRCVKCYVLQEPLEQNNMCLGIPMKVMEITDFIARCEARGIQRDVNLFMLQHEDIAVGDHVVVHVGYAIQKMTPVEARTTWELFDEMSDLEEAEETEIKNRNLTDA
jgi:hydrogenase expression/formation protein HypC